MSNSILSLPVPRARLIVLGLAVAIATSGCAQLKGRQGYVVDPLLTEAITPGVDNRESVQKTLGRPSFVGQFTPDDWYYFARTTKQLAFALPSPTQQLVLHVRFDSAGNVASVEKTGVEKVARIDPNGDKTPTLGKERSFFEDLFGNIGTVGAVGQGGSTTDNPN